MKILIVNTLDAAGGAAKAAYRLHRALLEADIDSQMLVQKKSLSDHTVLTLQSWMPNLEVKLKWAWDALPVRLYKNKSPNLFSPARTNSKRFVDKINALNPDIVNLHWINGGMLKIEDIARIKAPIVWTLHDNWAFTGGCHIKWTCEKYKSLCGACPQLGSVNESDLSTQIFKRKLKTYGIKKDITIVGPSRWLTECSKSSALLKDKEHWHIPNVLDSNVFKPLDRQYSRTLWNITKDKKIILFGAMNATTDINKGHAYLIQALSQIVSDNIELVVFGSSQPQNAPDLGFKTRYVGHLHDDVSLITLYSAADVMVVPSLQENLSNAIMESLACGTPVVGFDVGGNSDLIEHKKTGYLAKPFKSEDLAKGIDWVLTHADYNALSLAARNKVVITFDNRVVVPQYVDLYRHVIAKANV